MTFYYRSVVNFSDNVSMKMLYQKKKNTNSLVIFHSPRQAYAEQA